jgi:hypothetical protein
VKVVDETGLAVAGVPMVFDFGTGKETVATRDDGTAKTKGMFGRCRVSFESALLNRSGTL